MIEAHGVLFHFRMFFFCFFFHSFSLGLPCVKVAEYTRNVGVESAVQNTRSLGQLSRSPSTAPPFPPTTLPIPQETLSPLTRGVVFRSTRTLTQLRVPTSKRIYQRAANSSTTFKLKQGWALLHQYQGYVLKLSQVTHLSRIRAR
ncbi:hypothetical protein C8Q75DRAFT_615670 [Abortiporus biennis]|nr:hypothetical protein C8Q75DRAFT_615670 [Abortiporus biennis]